MNHPSTSRPRQIRWPIRSATVILLALGTLAACNPTTGSSSSPTASPAPTTSASPTASPNPSVPAQSAAPVATPSAVAETASCAVTDLAATGGGWDAAAGSRGIEVSVGNRGSVACVLPAGPTVAILDQAANVLLESPAASGGPGPTLEPGDTTSFTILMSNWCDQSVAPPLHVVLRIGDAGVEVQGASLSAEDLPPCNGPGQPPSLSTSAWE